MFFIKQEIFDVGLQVFQQEGIVNIIVFKDQFFVVKYVQFKVIEVWYVFFMKRWSQFLVNLVVCKKKFLEVQSYFCKVEDFFLIFVKKVFVFNSWFENVEEDLIDFVCCNFLEEIKVLCEVYDVFCFFFSFVQVDFNQLVELDCQIKSFCVVFNFYIWFIMEVLEEIWRNLQKIIKERELELQKEQWWQEENDKLCQEFVQYVNVFYQWI